MAAQAAAPDVNFIRGKFVKYETQDRFLKNASGALSCRFGIMVSKASGPSGRGRQVNTLMGISANT